MDMNISLIAYKAGRKRLDWSCLQVAEAQQLGIRYLRQNADGRVEVHVNGRMVWCKGVAKMPPIMNWSPVQTWHGWRGHAR